jgi:hypothetical protein
LPISIIVIPAKAGIQIFNAEGAEVFAESAEKEISFLRDLCEPSARSALKSSARECSWIPAFAGMTE